MMSKNCKKKRKPVTTSKFEVYEIPESGKKPTFANTDLVL